MSTTHRHDTDDDSDPTSTTTVYEQDFVRVIDHPRYDEEVTGRIVETLNEESVLVNVYTPLGPTDEYIRVRGSQMTLHPEGRLDVLEEHDTTFN